MALGDGVQPATAGIAMTTHNSPARAPEGGSSIAQRGRSVQATYLPRKTTARSKDIEIVQLANYVKGVVVWVEMG